MVPDWSAEHLAQTYMPELQLLKGGRDSFLAQFDLDALMDMDMDDSMPIYEQIRRYFKPIANSPLAAVPSTIEATGSPGMGRLGRLE